MKKSYIYLTTAMAMGLIACEPQFDTDINTTVASQDSGTADFSNYVALGASITAGYADGALFADGQNNAFPKIIADQMKAAGGGDFVTPSMDDNIGGFSGIYEEDGVTPKYPSRFVIDSETKLPVRFNDTPANDYNNRISGDFNNYGIPGIKSFDVLDENYGNPSGVATDEANPYFARIASADNATVIGDASAQSPTFFSLWLGGNDVLSYATAGGVGVLTDGEVEPTNDYDITNSQYFKSHFTSSLNIIKGGAGASGIVFNIPSVQDLPFFTRVAYNSINWAELEANDDIESAEDTVNAANTGYAAYNAGLTAALELNLIDVDEYNERLISFDAAGSDGVVIIDEYLTDLTVLNPALINMRKANENDRILLTAGSLLGTPAVEGDATTVYGIGTPLDDSLVLVPEELELIETATEDYNAIIRTAAIESGEDVMLFDAAQTLNDLTTTGITSNGTTVYGAMGSAFSFDGIHLSEKGNAVFANEVIEAINEHFGSTLQLVDPADFGNIFTVK